ncbi:glutamate decarboxylase [Neurospora tetrasperma FGSC 2508]|uniref:Glutamate decarboxylase n=1 Tax=Neurospora tetrasperma (strain FGSC 2508 / ATCC MYA-4615 / P0657) TaxID=510951 RepID=F8MQT7_NEUT8|nr:glutamate decarboxylase [Neurospora tetrasperma FGSC 2508]EGO56717.1 glutamate decarboxylase [Neurospora tetrasperma FGSC 2508]EGZ70408.1 glutamate decarboxylase [Neurospora tetrasperma FGSC 2509]
MVHLTIIPKEDEIRDGLDIPLTGALKAVHLQLANDEDRFTTSVYGSKFAAADLPRHEMPDEEMPKEVAYRMIKDELSLDGNPLLNLASFVTTYMEEEAEKLMTESLPKNFIDYEEYPQTADIQNRCVSMIGRLFNAPVKDAEASSAVGTSSVGSSEAIMLGVLAMKKRWKNKRIAEGKPVDKPNLIMSSAVQVCWEKATRYFEVEEKFVYCTPDRYVIDPKETVDLVDENTIGICCILGTTYTGEYEDVKAVNDLLVERGLDTPIHVDAASGGFVAPFVVPDLEWDFRLKNVVSINVSGHKYGLVYPGVGWVVWRSAEYLPQELVFNINYLGADQASFTLNFSKGASQVIGQYYQLIRLGKHGYRAIMSNLTRTADYLAESLAALGFIIMSQKSGQGLPLVAFRLKEDPDRTYDEFALAHQLRVRGWIVPAYTMAPKTEGLKMLRIVVREDFSRNRCDGLISDIRSCQGILEQMDKETVKKQQEFIHKHHVVSGKASHNHPKYHKEKHSLQGKTGKTHSIC